MSREESVKKKTARRKAKLLVELEKYKGLVATACKSAKISRATYYDWYRIDAAFREACDDIVERQTDVVEASLYKKILSQDITAIIFYLKTKGKSRGYVERKEIETEFVYSKQMEEALEDMSQAEQDILVSLAEKLESEDDSK